MRDTTNVRTPVDQRLTYPLAQKWYQVVKQIVKRSLKYSFGKHYQVKAIPPIYLTNTSYESCKQILKVLKYYKELSRGSVKNPFDTHPALSKCRDKNKQIIQNRFKQLKWQHTVKIACDDRLINFLVDKSLLYRNAFNNAARVFDYLIANNVNKIIKLDTNHNMTEIKFEVKGTAPSIHNMFDTRVLSTYVGFTNKPSKTIRKRATDVQRKIINTDNVNDEADKININWVKWTKNFGVGNVTRFLTIRRTVKAQNHLKKMKILPLPTKKIYDHVRQEAEKQ